MQRTQLKAWMERCCAALGSVWSCPLACHGRPNMAAPAAATLTLKTAATSVGTGATMPTTATVSARGGEVVGADHALAPGLVPSPGHVAAAIDPAPAAMTAAGTAPHLIPNVGRGLVPLCGQSPGPLLGVVPVLGQGPGPEGALRLALAPDPALPAIRGIGKISSSSTHTFKAVTALCKCHDLAHIVQYC